MSKKQAERPRCQGVEPPVRFRAGVGTYAYLQSSHQVDGRWNYICKRATGFYERVHTLSFTTVRRIHYPKLSY